MTVARAALFEQRSTEAAMINMLRRRYSRRYSGNGGGPLFVHAAQVRSTNWNAQTIDFLAMETSAYNGNTIHGHEVKVSRSDWLRELKQPEKCEAFQPFCDRWWLVVSDRAIVKDGELPEGWGMLAPSSNGRGLTVVKPAPRLAARQMPKTMVACFLRRVSEREVTP